MKKKAALFLTLSILIVLVGNYLFFNEFTHGTREKAIVARAIDGDTLELKDGRHIRLLNINTPEKTEKGSQEAKQFLSALENKTVELEITGTEKYGRLLARVYSPDYVNLEQVRQGNARMFLVNEKELTEFKQAQEDARINERGIWKRSQYYECLRAEINKKDEYVILTRECDVSLAHWTLQDESTKKYKFSDINAREFTLYSSEGKDTENKLYWNKGNVWNDDKDSLFIRDSSSNLVFYSSYGY